jgi:hypothetical protein
MSNKTFNSSTFDTEEEQEGKYNAGLRTSDRLKNSKYTSSKESKDAFKKKAAQKFENDQDLKQEAFTLSSQFVSFIKDKTLPENKSPIQLDLEADISRQLVDIVLKLNADETKPEGIGSAGGIMLLLRTVLIQRDEINKQGYKINQLEKEILQLKAKSSSQDS